jgi:large subunit ribosomal protein L14
MKAVKAKITKALQVGSYLYCIDNTGAKLLQIISVRGYKGRKRRIPKCGVADVVKCTVKKGIPKMRKQLVWAVIVRQKAEYRRLEGIRIRFEDNAAVLIDENFEPKGTMIKGPVAREVVERFPAVGRIAMMVV